MYNNAGINLNGLNGNLNLIAGLSLSRGTGTYEDAVLNGVNNWNYHECYATGTISKNNTNINAVSSYYEHPGFVIFKNNYSSAITARDNSNISFYNAARSFERWIFTS